MVTPSEERKFCLIFCSG